MKILIIIALFGFTNSELNKNFECVRNIKYEKKILKEDVSGPYQLAIDYDTNTLFFSFAARADEYFKIAHLNLKTKQYGIVSGISGGFANAVDNVNHVVYMGGSDGIYRYHYETKSATYLRVPREPTNIWQMFYRDGLYFTTYPNEQAFLYKGDVVVDALGADIRALTIAASKNGNIYYSNSTGLFSINKGTGNTVMKGEYMANAFSTDTDDNLYFSTANGIYYINEKNDLIEKILSVNDCYGVAIEGNDDIIYALSDSVVRLKQTTEKCVVELEQYNHTV